jgi:hypothetical protein
MGVYYSQYLIPTTELGRYRPSLDVVVALVRRLEANRWIEPDWKDVRILGAEHRTTTLSAAFAEDLSVFFDLGGPIAVGPFVSPDPVTFWGAEAVRPDGRSKAYDFDEDETAILKVEYVDVVHLIVTQTPHLVPNDEIRQAPCPSCGTDFLHESSREEEPDLALWSLLADVRVHLAEPCRTCGQSCPRDLSAPLPLFTFALRVSPPPKSSPPHSHGFADASLLNDLEDVTGIPFKMAPNWS